MGLSVEDLNTEEMAKVCEAPAYFMHAEGDEFVVLENTEKVHTSYKGTNKVLKTFAGDHNTERPAEVIAEAIDFLKTNLS